MKLITIKTNEDYYKLIKVMLLQNNRQLLRKYNRYNRQYNKELENNAPTQIKQALWLKVWNTIKIINEQMPQIAYMKDKAINSLNSSKNQKNKRLRNYITPLIKLNKAYFITLTFKNEILEKTNETTRRKYVQRTLKENTTQYVANIDYGKLNEREHYHAVTNKPITQDMWKYGYIECKKVGNEWIDTKKVSQYITKITLHALKETTHKNQKTKRLMYAKELPPFLW